MKSTSILSFAKLATLAAFLLAGALFAFAEVWTEPGAAPTGNNTPFPVNIGTVSQTKVGNLSVFDCDDAAAATGACKNIAGEQGYMYADRVYSWYAAYFMDALTIGNYPDSGTASPTYLSILGKTTLYNLRKAAPTQLGVSYPATLCTDSQGNISTCEGESVPADVPYTISDYIVRVENTTTSGSNLVVYCPADYPYVIGGTALCNSFAGATDSLPSYNPVMKSIPFKSAGATKYNAWQADCDGDNTWIQVQAICSK